MATQTFSITASGDDQMVGTSTQTTYPPPPTTPVNRATAVTEVGAQRISYSAASYENNVGLLRWDTSSLPDGATVTSATLRVYVTSKSSANSLSVTAEWYLFDSTNADYTNTPGTNAHAGLSIASLTTNSDNDLILSNAGANVSKTNYTGIRFFISQRTSDAAPTGLNYVSIAAFDHATNPEPRLIVTYESGVSYVIGGAYV